MASNRTVKVILSAQVREYIAGMEQAAKATRETGSEAEKLAQQKQALQTLGTGMLAVGGAITAVGAAALKTGIDYNTMQQTSRAALLTMLGSSQAVNEQMAKLDDFARNSPFSKQTFLAAQQQMLAFGIETQKVIPYLDAVQNAVAAAGGSNADIEAIVATMSKIQSSAKITAQDLNEFGNRGVNAAELIGSQMGKTGAEIRSEITAGTLGATEALDALAAGMSERFDGAAANVKQTFEGAMDRVKAAWRDFSAELARPLVDPEGGGMLVDMLNGLADAMRGFEKLPGPVKDTISVLTGVTGAALLAGGTMLLAVPKIAEFRNALRDLNISGSSVSGMLQRMNPMLLTLAAVQVGQGLVKMRDDMRGLTTEASALETQMRKTGDVSAELNNGLAGGPLVQFGDDARYAQGNLATLNTAWGDMMASVERSWYGGVLEFMSFGAMTTGVGKAQAQIEEFDAAVAALASSGESELAAQQVEVFAEMLREAGWSAEDINDALPEYEAAVARSGGATEEAATASERAASAYMEQADAASKAADQVFRLVDALMEQNGVGQSAEQANARYQQSLADVNEYVANAMAGVEGYSLSLDANTVEGSKNRDMLAGLAADSQAAAQALYEQEIKTIGAEQATENYRARLEQGREAIYNTALALTGSEEAAQALTDAIHQMPSEKEIQILMDTATAESRLADLTRGRTVTVSVQMANLPSQGSILQQSLRGSATAGADGFIEAYADGGISTGIYRGGKPIHKFAEPETVWEAYISGKPDQRERNRQIWVETGNRLDVFRDLEERIVKALGDGQRGGTTINYTSVNPVVRDDFEDAWGMAQEAGWR